MKKVRRASRRQRIPAFGEWNYDYGAGAGAGDWPVTQYFDSAMQEAGLVVAIPPSLKSAKKAVKWSGSATLELEDDEKQQQQVVVVGLGEHGAMKIQGKQSRVADDAVAHAAPAYKACRLAVKAVDQDLYQIPPDMLCHEPRKRLMRRSVWMGCLGLSCVA